MIYFVSDLGLGFVGMFVKEKLFFCWICCCEVGFVGVFCGI